MCHFRSIEIKRGSDQRGFWARAICLALMAGLPGLAQAQSYTDVSVEEAHTMWQGGMFTLDVRSTAEFRLAHIPGAHNINVTELADRLDELADLQSTDILVYCGVGGRSATASQTLVDNGFTGIHNMLGGLTAWQEADYETESSDAGFDEVSVENARRLQQGGALILDVRTPFFFCAGHIAGACNIPADRLDDRIGELENWLDEDIVVYCASGSCGLSTTAAAILADNGFTRVHAMPDGIDAWTEAGYETAKGIEPPLCCHADPSRALPAGGASGDLLVLLAAALVLWSLPHVSRKGTKG
ncbi:MAG: rhodanese-like domain-containing protein [Candidatus Hydrogenedentes bacterium]|nr:rhodanese-like domain-containing protein [Candidatus Hydrogenedentota bacterium]